MGHGAALAPLKHLANVNGDLQRALAAADVVFRFVDEPVEPDAGTRRIDRARGEIVFERVGFRYEGAERPALSGIDLRTKLLPDQLTLPLMWLGLVAASDNLYMPTKPALLGAMAGYLSLWSVYWVFKQLTGKEGMGHGDFKLLAALGAWTGLAGVLPTILLSSLVGAVVGSLWLAAKGKDKATPIPFGPYLAIAGWISFFWGKDLVGWYMRLAGLA